MAPWVVTGWRGSAADRILETRGSHDAVVERYTITDTIGIQKTRILNVLLRSNLHVGKHTTADTTVIRSPCGNVM